MAEAETATRAALQLAEQTLREKLTILSPIKYSEVPPKILCELDHENSSNSVGNTMHFGDKYRSDGDARTVESNRKPVYENHSASLLLTSAVNQINETVTDSVFEERHANNTNLDLADLVIVEALELFQEKDSGKITQNTPAENEVRLKQSSLEHNTKITLQNKSAIDESDLEVIEDTPTDDEDFFSQYVNRKNLEKVLRPSLVTKINATSLEDRDDEFPIITEDHNGKNEQNTHDLAIEADIAECINNILVRVCNNMENYENSQKQQERQIKLKSTKRNLANSNISTDISKTSKNKLKPDKKKTAKKDEDLNKITTSDTLVDRTNTTNATSIRRKRKLYTPKDFVDENNEIKSPRATSPQSNISLLDNPISIATFYGELEKARKSRRILGEKSWFRTQTKQSEDPPFKVQGRSSVSSKVSTPRNRSKRPVKPVKYLNAHYCTTNSSSDDDDFEHSRTGKPNIVLSSKKRKSNEMFDIIKKDVVKNEKRTLVEKKRCQKDSVYDWSIENENGDFKKKYVSLRKGVTPVSVDMPSRKRRRSISRVNYSEHNSTADEGQKTKKSKPVKQVRPRNCKENIISYPTPLVDERKRVAQESLETSFDKETVEVNNLEEPEPLLQQAPALEVMRPDKLNEAVAGDKTPSKLNTTKIKKENYKKTTKAIAAKRSKKNIKRVSKENDSASASPFPGLAIEKVRTRKDDLTASLGTNLLQKFNKIYTTVQVSSEQPDFTENSPVHADENENAVLDPNDILDTALVADDISEKSIAKSHATTKKETLQTENKSSASKRNSADKNNQDMIKSVVSLPETTAPTVSSDRRNRSVACVNEWFNENFTQSASRAAANHNHINREIFCRMLEAIKATLPEITNTTNERLEDELLKTEEKIKYIRQDVNIISDRLTEIETDIKQRRRQICRDDAKQKQATFKLLEDDIMRLLGTTEE